MALANVASCTDGTSTATLLTTGADFAARGQSFTPSQSGLLYRIDVDLRGDADVTLRWGTQSDLSGTSHRAEGTSTFTTDGYVSFTFTTSDGNMTLTTGKTYYFGIAETSGAGAMVTGGTYAGGKVFTAATAAGWNMASSAAADHNFVVYIHADETIRRGGRLRTTLRL